MPDFTGIPRRADSHLYLRIAAIIEEAIASGELGPRDPVPSERDIMQASGASRWAVRHAMAYLREQGKIYTVAGLGSFVSPPR